MEAILRGRDAAEVIPFDWSAPVLYYPVRHHSPACAWHLERAMERYQPQLVLVEGPENANDLIPILAHPETKAPVALYYAYRDDAGLLREEAEAAEELPPENYACYYPFLDQSPELAALRLAQRMGIPARFMDSPMARYSWPPDLGPVCGRMKPPSAMPMTGIFPRPFCGSRCVKKPVSGTLRSSGKSIMKAGALPCPPKNLCGR